MQDFEDAYGHLMYGFLKGRATYEIIEPDDGFRPGATRRRLLFSHRKWGLNHRKAMQYVKGRVLDIGCGARRHSIYNIEGNWIENQTLHRVRGSIHCHHRKGRLIDTAGPYLS